MKSYVVIILLSLTSLSSIRVLAQDAIYATPNSAYLYTNPGFSGTSGKLRVNNIFKNQHPLLPGNYNTNYLSADHYFKGHGVGVYFLADEAGAASLSKLEFAGMYSYLIPVSDHLSLSAGLGIGLGQSRLNLDKAIFEDQKNDDYSINPVSSENFNNASKAYLEINSGLVLFHKDFWVGVSGHHLNKPKIYSFAQDFTMSRRFGAQAGYVYRLKTKILNRNLEDKNLMITSAEFNVQGNKSRLMISEKVYYNSVIGALSLSHLSLDKIGLRSLLIGAGYNYQFFTFMYGYELYFNNINGVGGAHELQVNVRFDRGNNSSNHTFNNKKSIKTFCPLK